MVRLPPRARRTVLEQLSRDRLSELTTRFELDVNDRRSTDSHIDAIVRKRSLDFRRVLDALQREELQAACEVLGLDPGGREKAKLVERILGTGERGLTDAENDAGDDEPVQTSQSPSSTPPPMSVRSTGVLKSELRRFVLDVAGGYRGRDASTEFTSKLLRCFGWPDGRARDASMPASLSVVANGERATTCSEDGAGVFGRAATLLRSLKAQTASWIASCMRRPRSVAHLAKASKT